jgi:hypothetical protein
MTIFSFFFNFCVFWNRASSARGGVWLLLVTPSNGEWLCFLSLSFTHSRTPFSSGSSPINCGWSTPARWFLVPNPTGFMTIYYSSGSNQTTHAYHSSRDHFITGSLLSVSLSWCQASCGRSQSYFTTGGLAPISSSWCQAPWSSRQERPTVKVIFTLQLAVYRQSVGLGASPLRITTRDFFLQLDPCRHSPYVTSSLRRCVCLLRICLAFCEIYVSHM